MCTLYIVLADALSYILNATTDDNSSQQPSFPDTVIPKLTLLNDRCWCELSGARLFEPFNTTLWQLNSFARTVGVSHKQTTKPAESEDVNDPESHEIITVIENDKISNTNRNWIAHFVAPNVETFFSTGLLLERWRQHGFNIFRTHSVITNISNLTDSNPKQLTRDLQLPAVDLGLSRPVIRPVYDLRSYGIDLVLDFQWPRSNLDTGNTIITEGD
ncbi:hypothetical protein Clacol_003606 [Clathrus columnatus]|uniref:Uncharacterized protein n=1 Tax=Clathrus columnatus TaxID=1419009 RepID=A0AAV5A9H1_9AGAM|nr:hypothetical protein Clacol_003606 [Clathrus columnatus]